MEALGSLSERNRGVGPPVATEPRAPAGDALLAADPGRGQLELRGDGHGEEPPVAALDGLASGLARDEYAACERRA